MNTKTKNIIKTVLKSLIVLTIFICVILNYDTLKNLDVRNLTQGISNIYVIFGIILGVYALKSIVFVIPAIMIYLSVGMMFDVKTALIINAIGIALEVLITYFFGRFLGGNQVREMLIKNKGGQKLLTLYEGKKKFTFLLIVRVLPVFPIDFSSLFLGASKFSFPSYMLVSFLGIMPRVALFTILGDSVYKYFPKELLIKLIIILIPVGAVGYIVYKIVKKKKKTDG